MFSCGLRCAFGHSALVAILRMKIFEIRYSETGNEGYFEQRELSIVAPDLEYAIKRFNETHRGHVIHWICVKSGEVVI